MANHELLIRLKSEVIKRSSDPSFVHHKWFVKYHLEIVEAIAMELCDIYDKADRPKVLILVWLHDYEKILEFDNEHNKELVATRTLMRRLGFNEKLINEVCADINTINSKSKLNTATIEVQIVSSSDGASHFVGPFGALYWHENPEVSVEDIQAERQRKIAVDWEDKITLPEVKKAFLNRYYFMKETAGNLPKKYLS